VAFGVRLEGSLPAVLAGFTLCALAFFALGYLLAGVAPSARVAQTIGMVIAYPMMFLSGASLPLELLPPGLRHVADFIPLTYVVELMRGLWFGDPWTSLWLPIVVLTGILILATTLSARVFRWQYRTEHPGGVVRLWRHAPRRRRPGHPRK
jgi:ABC-2 type transport system permease protein